MQKSTAVLMAFDLDLVDNPARRQEAASRLCIQIAVVAAMLAVMFTVISAMAAMVIVYLANGMLALTACTAWFFAGWFERRCPANDIPLSVRDAATVDAHLERMGAKRHYVALVHREKTATYATVRDLIAKACAQAMEDRQVG